MRAVVLWREVNTGRGPEIRRVACRKGERRIRTLQATVTGAKVCCRDRCDVLTREMCSSGRQSSGHEVGEAWLMMTGQHRDLAEPPTIYLTRPLLRRCTIRLSPPIRVSPASRKRSLAELMLPSPGTQREKKFKSDLERSSSLPDSRRDLIVAARDIEIRGRESFFLFLWIVTGLCSVIIQHLDRSFKSHRFPDHMFK